MKAILISLLALSAPAFAALPPYWDSVSQLMTVLQSTEVSEALRMGKIESVTRVTDELFTVTTDRCSADVYLKVQRPNHPGPNKYSLDEVKNVYCK